MLIYVWLVGSAPNEARRCCTWNGPGIVHPLENCAPSMSTGWPSKFHPQKMCKWQNMKSSCSKTCFVFGVTNVKHLAY